MVFITKLKFYFWWKNHQTNENKSKYIIRPSIAALGIVVHCIDGKKENDLIRSVQSVFCGIVFPIWTSITKQFPFDLGCDQCDIALCSKMQHGTRDQHHFIESIKMLLVLFSRWIKPFRRNFVWIKMHVACSITNFWWWYWKVWGNYFFCFYLISDSFQTISTS